MKCHVTTLAGERLDCNNDNEFDSLTRKNFGLFFKRHADMQPPTRCYSAMQMICALLSKGA